MNAIGQRVPTSTATNLAEICRVAGRANGDVHTHLHETHISWVVLAGPSAYKLKKPVDFGFLDFTTRDRRAHACHREVILNRRLCPEMYLGVMPVTSDGKTVALGGRGEVVDYAVLMRRLPSELMLDRVLQRDAVRTQDIRAVADRLAAFHTVAATGESVDRYGSMEIVLHNANENFEQTRQYCGRFFDERLWTETRDASLRFLSWAAPLFDRRLASGRVRDGHGDLHVGNVCLTHPVTIYDCIEFNDRFRCGDVAADIAFLAMDLEFHGRGDLARAFVDRYVGATGDVELESMLPYYISYRAFVRAKIELFRLDQIAAEGGSTDEGQSRVERYLTMAHAYATRLGPPTRHRAAT